MLNSLIKEFQDKASPERARHAQGFFKTGKGQYGEGDVFLGLTMPEQKKIIQKYIGLPLTKVQKLLDSEIHEYRMAAGIILTHKYKKDPEEIFNFYLKNAKKFNNWDLVDITCTRVIGQFLFDNPQHKKILYQLARSKDLWEKRIAIVSTYTFIKYKEFEDTLAISELLLKDTHDLIHKAIGWMLREVGKKDEEVLKNFLKQHYNQLPRTTLRYAIERFPEQERKKWLTLKK